MSGRFAIAAAIADLGAAQGATPVMTAEIVITTKTGTKITD